MNRQPPLRPTLEQAIEHIQRSVEFAKGRIWGGFPHEHFLLSVAALNHVVWAIDPLQWAWNAANGVNQPAADPEQALSRRAGLCGHAALTYAAIMHEFGLPVRSAQFYWTTRFGDRNHIACEVFYDGAWRYFDPTWGAFYEQGGQVLGIESVRAGAEHVLRRDETLLFALVGDSWSDLRYVSDAATRLELDGYDFERILRT